MPIEQIRALNPDAQPPERGKAAGRSVTRRTKGKLHVLDIGDGSGRPIKRWTRGALAGKHEPREIVDWSSRIQVMIGQQEVGETGWALAQQLDLGDLLGVEGTFTK